MWLRNNSISSQFLALTQQLLSLSVICYRTVETVGNGMHWVLFGNYVLNQVQKLQNKQFSEVERLHFERQYM